MRHMMYGEKSLFVDDELAELLMEYAMLIAIEGAGAADAVTLPAIGSDGNLVEVALLLTPSTNLVSETTSSQAEAPVDEWAAAQLRERIRRHSVHEVVPEEDSLSLGADEDFI